mmetsp:Transcript_27313/g.47348  ORF Transcript_27313/g.47348 Transcript_27313/m.47348 type:complete len:220 (+) Transcript_27313:158-817(+)
MACPLKEQHNFPFKLYDMLEYVADSEYSSAMSWIEEGTAFAIRNKDTFLKHIVPMFFKQTKFRSFVSLSFSFLSIYILSLVSIGSIHTLYACPRSNRPASSIYGDSRVSPTMDPMGGHGSTRTSSAEGSRDSVPLKGMKSRIASPEPRPESPRIASPINDGILALLVRPDVLRQESYHWRNLPATASLLSLTGRSFLRGLPFSTLLLHPPLPSLHRPNT